MSLLVLAVVAGVLVLFRQPIWDRVDLETKHRIVAVYSRLTARKVGHGVSPGRAQRPCRRK